MHLVSVIASALTDVMLQHALHTFSLILGCCNADIPVEILVDVLDHLQGVDFSRIQRSGVSIILLQGERYTAPPNMKRMELLDRWH